MKEWIFGKRCPKCNARNAPLDKACECGYVFKVNEILVKKTIKYTSFPYLLVIAVPVIVLCLIEGFNIGWDNDNLDYWGAVGYFLINLLISIYLVIWFVGSLIIKSKLSAFDFKIIWASIIIGAGTLAVCWSVPTTH